MDILLILMGLILLFVGGEGLVKGSVALAERMGISTLLVSLVIIGFGTSAPELLVCIKAALSGTADLAVGNVIGSNIANILLILGVASIIAPLSCTHKAIRRDSLMVIVASTLVAAISFLGLLSWISGIALITVLFGYLSWSYWNEKHETPEEKKEDIALKGDIVDVIDTPHTPALKACLLTLGGLLALMLGADWLVTGASSIARSYGVPDVVIGLSLVALGTSLPELATAIIASLKGHSDVIIGNVLGSNLFNILGILGTTAIISPLSMSGRVMQIDIWLMLGSAIILYPALISGRKISRAEGIIFLSLYVGYIASMFIF